MRHHVDNPQDVPTPELPSYVFPPTILENSRPGGLQNSSHLEARREKGQLDEVSQAPGAFQQEAPAPAQQSRAVPTALHYRAIKQLNTAELVGLINEFLQQNAARFDAFLARRQAYVPTTFVPKRAKPGSPIKTTFSHTWDSQVELDLLTQAISWLDKLLAPFRTAILKEDQDSLKPRIEQAVREFEATGVPSRLRTGEQWSIADRVLAQHFTDSMTGIRSTNSVRKQLFEYISIDVLTFDNLLSSAENIRYRRDLGREYGQKDDLVDGLRRIYSTIACTIPVGLSEQDPIEQPAQPHKIAYDNDMYYPYELPSRPEIFDHPSASLNSISSTRVTGIQTTGQRTPLRQGYFQKLQADMMGTIAAQRDDEVGIVKMSRNSTSKRCLGEFGKGTKRPDLTIDPGSHKNDSQFKNPFQSGAQHSEPMDSEQSPGDRHLPSHTPTEPRSLRQSEPLGKAQHPPFKQVTDTTGSHNVDLAHNDRKRSRSSGQIPWRGGDLVDWMTTEDGQAMTELGRRNLRDQREGNVPMDDLSDYPGDDEDDTNETQRGYRPPKRQKNGKTSHNSRGASGRGRH
ncbi:hypothetical protein N0V87_002976 [Didymella glomerata]|uniref:Uncharacterized protein n=1 Tax=Didymella glomerata TaxID=749621 RepID=A0A9W9C1T8_9PLEO|nr:hypothetical protein N0V87_002976 [Didymella glomerata]